MKNTNYFQLFLRCKKHYKAEVAELKSKTNALANKYNDLLMINENLYKQIEHLNALIDKKDESFDKLLSILEATTKRANNNQFHE